MYQWTMFQLSVVVFLKAIFSLVSCDHDNVELHCVYCAGHLLTFSLLSAAPWRSVVNLPLCCLTTASWPTTAGCWLRATTCTNLSAPRCSLRGNTCRGTSSLAGVWQLSSSHCHCYYSFLLLFHSVYLDVSILLIYIVLLLIIAKH